MPKKATDHKPFLNLVGEITLRSQNPKGQTYIEKEDVVILVRHRTWLKKLIADAKKASASRQSFGPKRKPDHEVSANAIRMRATRDAKKKV